MRFRMIDQPDASDEPMVTHDLQLASAALVVVSAADELGAAAAKLLAHARRARMLIINVRPGFDDESAQIEERLDLGPADLLVNYRGASPFGVSGIDLVLRVNGIRSLIVLGDNRDARVDCLGYDAQRRGYRVFAVNEVIDAKAYACPFFGVQHLPLEQLHGLLDTQFATARDWLPEVKASGLVEPLSVRVRPGRAALLVIDVLNDFCSVGGVIDGTHMAAPAVAAALPRIQALLDSARAAGMLVIHVQAMYGLFYRGAGSPYRYKSEDTIEGAVWCASAADLEPAADGFDPAMVELCLDGTWGRDFVPGIAPLPGEKVITKHRYSAFADTPLDSLLRREGIDTLVLAGVTTNCCVESTARDAAMADYFTVVASDCVAVKDAVMHLHHATLEQIQTYFGVVTPSSRLMTLWSGGANE